MLLQLGLLGRHPSDPSSYLFCVPGLGTVVKSILGGRAELVALVSRKRYKEVGNRQEVDITT